MAGMNAGFIELGILTLTVLAQEELSYIASNNASSSSPLDKIPGVDGKRPEVLLSGQAIKRLLDSDQEITVLHEKSGEPLDNFFQLACVVPYGDQ